MILVFGRSGQVAIELARLAPDAVCLGRDRVDLSDPAACGDAIQSLRPQAVINAAAYTAVDKAETEQALALAVNGQAPGAMARACAALNIPFCHISTDYVFDGSGGQAWLPGDTTGPLGVYGRTKLAGEDQVRAAGGTHAILRTSWVFSATGSNFVKTMLRLSETRNSLSVVADQIGGPTPAAAIAQALLAMTETFFTTPDASGTYHFAGAPDVSWAGFAREIFAQAERAVTITDIPASDYPTPARRPQNSRLDCSSFTRTFGLPRPDWRAGLADVLKDLGAKP